VDPFLRMPWMKGIPSSGRIAGLFFILYGGYWQHGDFGMTRSNPCGLVQMD